MENKIRFEKCDYNSCPCCKNGLCKNRARYEKLDHSLEIEKRYYEFKAHHEKMLAEKGELYVTFREERLENAVIYEELYDLIFECLYIHDAYSKKTKEMAERFLLKLNKYLNVDCPYCKCSGKIKEIYNEFYDYLENSEESNLDNWDDLENIDYDDIYGNIDE